jgi:hypothetical protein
MMLQSLAAPDRSQVPDDAVMAVAHSSQMAVLEAPHPMRMHWLVIPSILYPRESIGSDRQTAALTCQALSAFDDCPSGVATRFLGMSHNIGRINAYTTVIAITQVGKPP